MRGVPAPHTAIDLPLFNMTEQASGDYDPARQERTGTQIAAFAVDDRRIRLVDDGLAGEWIEGVGVEVRQ